MLTTGTVFADRYQVLREIGRGGSSVVYLVMDQKLNKQMAVKELGRDMEGLTNIRLTAEADLLRKLDHEAIPKVYDVVETDRSVMIVMEYIEGTPLSQITVELPLQEDRLMDWFVQLAEVLLYIHSHGIVYRDMKPGNVILQPDGRLKLLDFGISGELGQTVRGEEPFVGTSGYAAPETSGGSVDQRSDIFSLGMTMYHLAVGERWIYLYDDISVRRMNPALSEDLDRIISKCTRSEPQDRYQTAKELLYDLKSCSASKNPSIIHRLRSGLGKLFGEPAEQAVPEAAPPTLKPPSRYGTEGEMRGAQLSSLLFEYPGILFGQLYETVMRFAPPVSLARLTLTGLRDLRYVHIFGGSFNFGNGESPKTKKGAFLTRDGQCLVLFDCAPEISEKILERCAEQLEVLDIRDFGLPRLDLSAFINLRFLSLCPELSTVMPLPAVPNGLEELRLTRIYSDDGLDLDDCGILRALTLHGCTLPAITASKPLPTLEKLFASDQDVPLPDLRLFPNLEWLDLSGSSIHEVPDEIRELAHLRRLGLRNLHLNDLPDWIAERAYYFEVGQHATIILGEKGIYADLEGTVIDAVDEEILSRPINMVRDWFRARRSGGDEGQVPLNEIKVVFLGDGSAGKTYTIARLLNDCRDPLNYTDKATPGISIRNMICSIDGAPVQIHFWDFGGQEILHSMHRMFLTERTIYVILVDARSEQRDEQAKYWLNSVRSFAGEAPVILALNKMDENPNASIDEAGLRKKYGAALRRVVRMSAKNDSESELRRGLLDVLLDEIRRDGTFANKWNRSWVSVKRSLQQMTEPYIFGSDYDTICMEQGVDAQSRISLLGWFNDLGISVCYHRDVELSHYVILRPDWITNALYSITFNRPDDLKNGILTHREIFALLNNAAHRVKTDEVYNYSDLDYILRVARKFHLSYPVSREREFFPSLCDHNTMDVVEEYAADPAALEFRISYDHLPVNVLHRLMVDMNRELDMEHIWLTGARFHHKSTGLSAVVQKDGACLKLYVRSTDPRFPADMYLDTMRHGLGEINRELNLKTTREEIGYKELQPDGRVITEFFNYRVVKGSRQIGLIYSEVLDREIPVEEILHRSSFELDWERAKLLGDLRKCCLQMQDNTYLGHLENARNTELRNLLTNLGQNVRDQSLGGFSASGLQPGERDLVFFRKSDRGIIWTMLEALNIRGTSNTDKENWNEHLQRLMNRYDQMGLPFQILVSYVNCTHDKFIDACNGYFHHIKHRSPEGCAVQSMLPVNVRDSGCEETSGFKIRRCVYDCGGYQKTIYHVFVRFEPEKGGQSSG